MKAAEEIRLKYQGKPQDMPADEQERWEKALEDFDRYKAQHASAKKQEAMDAWAKELDVDPGVMKAVTEEDGDVDVRDIKAQAAALMSDKWPVAKTVHEKTFQKWVGASDARYLKLSEAEEKALSAGDSDAGGYLVLPLQLSNKVFEILRNNVFMRSWATVEPVVAAESLGVPTFDTEVEDTDWTSEILTGNEDDTEPVGRRDLRPHPLAKRIKISRKLVRQAANAERMVLSRLGYKCGVVEEAAFLTGSGVNQPLGVMTESTQGISTNRNKASATANVVAGDDFWNTLGMLKHGYRASARWIIHRNLETRLRKLKDSANNYIWQPGFIQGRFLVEGYPSTICGLPYAVTEYLTDPSDSGNITTGTMAAIVGDFSFYMIADALDLSMQRLDELYAATNQIGYILRKETDGMPILEEAFARLKVS